MLSGANDPAPLSARSVGYAVETFESTFEPAKIDTKATYASGFQWYLMNFYGYPPMAPSGYRLTSAGVMLTGLTGYQNGGGLGQLATAGTRGWQKPWVGTAFGGGTLCRPPTPPG